MFSTHLSSLLVDAGQVDLRHKLHGRWDVWVVLAAVDVEAIDSIFVGALCPVSLAKKVMKKETESHMRWSKDCAVPIGHQKVIPVR